MSEIMHELYYMIDGWADQQFRDDEKAKSLEKQKSTLEDEIMRRIGDGGQELLETLSRLILELETIHDEALFRAALSLGTEAAHVRRKPWTAEAYQCLQTGGSKNRGRRVPARARRKGTRPSKAACP